MSEDIKLSTKQFEEAKKLYRVIEVHMINIAKLTEKALIAESQRREAFLELDKARKVFEQRAANIVSMYGIDVESENWDFDLDHGVIRKRAQPPQIVAQGPAPQPDDKPTPAPAQEEPQNNAA